MVSEIERAQGVCGELVLRRGPAGLEIIASGVFLVSAANAASSRALVSAAWSRVAGDGLRVFIGGLGIGDALAETLACERAAEVTVAELEPVVVRWFREHGGAVARCAAEAERAGRLRVVTADAAEVLGDPPPSGWDVVALDTDNGPEWLVRDENSGLYSGDGLSRVHAGLRPGGVAVFWSPERYAEFETRLAGVFGRVDIVPSRDVIEERCHDYTMYVAHRSDADGPRLRA